MTSTLDAAALFREQVARARAMPPGEGLLERPRLFDRACELMKAGIRHRHLDASDEEVLVILQGQLDRIRAIENRYDER